MSFYKNACLLLLLFITFLPLGAQKYKASDAASGALKAYAPDTGRSYRGIEIQRMYVRMPDSTLLATDVYLPRKRREGERFPVILHQTRYWRAAQVNWPFSMFTQGFFGIYGQMIKRFIASGYVIVNVDVRGTGASFGRNDYPWSEQEVADGYEICNWIVQQPWADGNIGSVGGSYSGTAAEFLAGTCHPNVKAVVLMYSLFDVYDDIAFPNGNHFEWFTGNWGKANTMLDNNKLPVKNGLVKMLVSGVAKVPGKDRNQVYKAAIASHKDNIGVDETSKGVDFRNVPPLNRMIDSIDIFSPHAYLQRLNACGTPVYSYSGWYDGDYQAAAVKRHLNLQGEHHKLIIGPWNHGGKFNCSPFNPGNSGFDHAGEVQKFFDRHLRNYRNGLEQEAPVHYFTMGEEQWKATDTWPPQGFDPETLYLGHSLQLQRTAPVADTGQVQYTVNNALNTGNDTRWKSLKSELKTADAYSDIKQQLKDALTFTAEPYAYPVEITGHPLVELYFSSGAEDGAFFVYLLDESPDGNYNYITEGSLRLIHRAEGECPDIYNDVVPCHTFRKADARPLQPGAADSVRFDMLPVSYLLPAGHRLKVCITNSDISHFKTYQPDGTVYTLFTNARMSSRIQIPLKRKGE
ncbi:MAG: CocE/NonD family hydrolase [Bacteroidia bacterium]|nr:CocE/NonD family hydrolase [Bacteroidia bacterium]